MKKRIAAAILFLHCSSIHIHGQSMQSFPVKNIILPTAASVEDEAGQPVLCKSNSVHVRKLSDSLYYITADIVPGKNVRASVIDIPLQIKIDPNAVMNAIKNSFHWLPNMKSAPGQIISQHVFRSPCIILTFSQNSLVFVPDVKAIAENGAAPYYMDLQYNDSSIRVMYGLSEYKVVPHQYYQRSGKSFQIPEKIRIGFYLLFPGTAEPLAVLKATNQFLWQGMAKKYTLSYLPQTVSYSRYAELGYDMALTHYWVDAGKGKGGIALSTYFDDSLKIYRGRDSRDDLWYQSWFNNMRTAYGMYSWGSRLQKPDWKNKALEIINLLMEAPKDNGWFPTVYNKQDRQWITSGQGGGPDVYHVPDNAWTAYWLLRFTEELKNIPGADEMLLSLGNAFIKVQNADGSFPARVWSKHLLADTVLNHTASSALATWYLEELMLRKKIPDSLQAVYQQSVKRSLDFLTAEVLPGQRFEDFESYFSCSPKPMHYYDSSTNMYAQNTLSIQWCAEAYLKAFRLFNQQTYLANGEYCLNIMSLYQQVWNPPFINLYAFGGFGTQNSDAEWSDARQAQFADTYLQYYQVTQNEEYLQRGVYACRAAFALMVLPENKNICPENYTGTKINGEEWTGNMAENYGHSGHNQRSNQSGFHWGTGSALTTAAIFKQMLGDLYLDIGNKTAVGIDGLVVTEAQWNKIPQIKTKRIKNGEPVTIKTKEGIQREILLDERMTKTGTNEN